MRPAAARPLPPDVGRQAATEGVEPTRPHADSWACSADECATEGEPECEAACAAAINAVPCITAICSAPVLLLMLLSLPLERGPTEAELGDSAAVEARI